MFVKPISTYALVTFRLCQPVPIDVVFTWVNGSDPRMIADLKHARTDFEKVLNETHTHTGNK